MFCLSRNYASAEITPHPKLRLSPTFTKSNHNKMTTEREQRLQKRKEVAATKAEVRSRFTAVRALPGPVKNCLRSLVSFKDSLALEVKTLRDARLKDEETLKESEDEVKTLRDTRIKDDETIKLQKEAIQLLEEGHATLKSLVQNLTRDNEILLKQNNLLSSSYEDVLNEHKKLVSAVNTAGSCLAEASMAVNIVM